MLKHSAAWPVCIKMRIGVDKNLNYFIIWVYYLKMSK